MTAVYHQLSNLVRKYHSLPLLIFVPYYHSSLIVHFSFARWRKKGRKKSKTDDETSEWFWGCVRKSFLLLLFQAKTSVVFLFFFFMHLSWRTRFIQQSQSLLNSFVQKLSGTQVKTPDKSISKQMPKGSREILLTKKIICFMWLLIEEHRMPALITL